MDSCQIEAYVRCACAWLVEVLICCESQAASGLPGLNAHVLLCLSFSTFTLMGRSSFMLRGVQICFFAVLTFTFLVCACIFCIFDLHCFALCFCTCFFCIVHLFFCTVFLPWHFLLYFAFFFCIVFLPLHFFCIFWFVFALCFCPCNFVLHLSFVFLHCIVQFFNIAVSRKKPTRRQHKSNLCCGSGPRPSQLITRRRKN